MSDRGRRARAMRVLARGRWRARRGLAALVRSLPGRAPGAIETVSEPLQGSVSVEGWAHRRRDPVVAVLVTVDGTAMALATLGRARPDIATRVRGAERSGWFARVDLSAIDDGIVEIGAQVVGRSGLVEHLSARRFHHAQTVELGAVTRPAPGSEVVAGPLIIEGWALPSALPVRIETSVNGEPTGRARPFALPYGALATTSPLPWAALGGFTHVIDVSHLAPGAHVHIGVEIETLPGDRGSLSGVDVRIAASSNSRGKSTTAQVAPSLRVGGDRTDVSSPAALRLLVVTHQLDLGGGQLYLYELLRHLLEQFDVSCLVVSTTDGVLRSRLEDLGAFVHECGRPSTTNPDEYEELIAKLTILVDEHECNVAIVNTMSCAFGADLAARLEIPYLWAVHESYTLGEFFLAAYGENGLHPTLRERTEHALGSAAAVVFEADQTRRLYEPHGDPRRFVTIRYGIPLAEVEAYRRRTNRAELRRAQGFAERDVVLLCVGTYEPRKGQGALALAFAEIAQEFPDAVLVMVGDTGITYAKAVRDVVERLRLEHRVRLMPVVEDVYAWYVMADAFVTVSDVESLPRSVLEAMALGQPVIAVDVFGLGELLDDGVTGLLCEPRDVEAMIGVLRRFLGATPAERTGLAQGGADLVHARYDSSGYADAYLRLLRGFVADPHALPGDFL